jgi:hypothetical protein
MLEHDSFGLPPRFADRWGGGVDHAHCAEDNRVPRWAHVPGGAALARWEIWFFDFYEREVVRVGSGGKARTVVESMGQPSALGWLPEGRLLVVSMTVRRLMCFDLTGLTVAADHSLCAHDTSAPSPTISRNTGNSLNMPVSHS